MLSEPPLVGRDRELDHLNDLLQQAISGSGGLVLLAGEAGIGKTRLATEFEKIARASGCKVLVGNCLPSAQIPYLVFLEALNHLFEEQEHDKSSRYQRLTKAAKKAAPDLMKAIPVIGGTMKASAKLFEEYRDGSKIEVSKEHVLFKALDIITKESARTPLVLHLDDLQWADSMSIAMLHFLARNCRDIRVMLLGTYRSEEVLNQEQGIHPLLDSIRVMKREGIVQEVHLNPLGEKELHSIVSGMLGMSVDVKALERIFKESGGSPLFAVETVRMLADSEAFVMKDGVLIIKGKAEQIPSSVLEVIKRRIERVARVDRKTLDYSSVIGLDVDTHLLSGSMKTEPLNTIESLEKLERQHQLMREKGEEYAFTHEKVRHVTYSGISNIRKRELHRAVGETMELGSVDERLSPLLSDHFHNASVREKCIEYSLKAGKYLLRRHSYSEANLHLNRCLDWINNDERYSREICDCMMDIGFALMTLGDSVGASNSYACVIERTKEKKLRLRALCQKAICWSPTSLGQGNAMKALELLDEAEGIEGIDLEDLACISASRGLLNMQLRELKTALDFCSEASQLYQQVEDDIKTGKQKDSIDPFNERMRNFCLIANHDCLLGLGRTQEAFAMAENLLTISQELEDPLLMSLAEYSIGVLLNWGWRDQESIPHFLRALDLAERMGDWEVVYKSLRYLSSAYFATEDYQLAIKLGKRAISLQGEEDGVVERSYSYYQLGKVLLNNGDLEEGMLYVEKLHDCLDEVSDSFRTYVECDWLALRALAKYLQGDNSGGDDDFEKVLTLSINDDDIKYHIAYRVAYAQALMKRGEHGRARKHLETALKYYESTNDEGGQERMKDLLNKIPN